MFARFWRFSSSANQSGRLARCGGFNGGVEPWRHINNISSAGQTRRLRRIWTYMGLNSPPAAVYSLAFDVGQLSRAPSHRERQSPRA